MIEGKRFISKGAVVVLGCMAIATDSSHADAGVFTNLKPTRETSEDNSEQLPMNKVGSQDVVLFVRDCMNMGSSMGVMISENPLDTGCIDRKSMDLVERLVPSKQPIAAEKQIREDIISCAGKGGIQDYVWGDNGMFIGSCRTDDKNV